MTLDEALKILEARWRLGGPTTTLVLSEGVEDCEDFEYRTRTICAVNGAGFKFTHQESFPANKSPKHNGRWTAWERIRGGDGYLTLAELQEFTRLVSLLAEAPASVDA